MDITSFGQKTTRLHASIAFSSGTRVRAQITACGPGSPPVESRSPPVDLGALPVEIASPLVVGMAPPVPHAASPVGGVSPPVGTICSPVASWCSPVALTSRNRKNAGCVERPRKASDPEGEHPEGATPEGAIPEGEHPTAPESQRGRTRIRTRSDERGEDDVFDRELDVAVEGDEVCGGILRSVVDSSLAPIGYWPR